MDDNYYMDWAKGIISGDWLSKGQGVFFLSPGYPYFVALLFAIFGTNLFVVYVVQYVIGTFTCVIVYLLSLELSKNRTVAVLSAIIASFYGVSLFYESRILSPTLINFLNLMMVLMLILSFKERKAKYWLFAGIFMGFSSLVRPNIFLFVPFLLLSVIIDRFILHEKSYFIQNCRNFIIFCVGSFIIVLPVLIRNYHFDRKFAMTVSSGGMNFYLGNNEYADGLGNGPPFVLPEQEKMQISFRQEAERRLNKKINNWAEVSDYWFGESLRWIRKNPLKFIQLEIRKIIYLFTATEAPGNYPLFMIEDAKKMIGIPLFHWGLIAPLGIIGATVAIRKIKNISWFLIYAYASVYIVSNLIFFIRSEYRFPLVPILIIFSLYFINRLVEIIRQKKYKLITITIVLVVALVILSNKRILVEDMSIKYYNDGVIFANRGMKEKAIESYVKSIKAKPDFTAAKENLGVLYFEKKLYQDALKQFQEILKINPSYEEARYNIAMVFYEMKNYESAEKLFKELIKTNNKPGQVCYYLGMINFYREDNASAFTYFKKAIEFQQISGRFNKESYLYLVKLYRDRTDYNNAIKIMEELIKTKYVTGEDYFLLGDIYKDKGSVSQTIECYRGGITMEPDNADGYVILGNFYKDIHQYDSAIREYKNAIKINSSHIDARNNLGLIYFNKGQYNEALMEYKQLIQISPNFDKAHFNLGVLYLIKNQHDEAILAFVRSIELNPNRINAHAFLGDAYFAKRMFEKAKNEYEFVLRVNPNNAEIQKKYGDAIAQLRK
ncbi:MAG: tetratricopeptide repeat protein [Elusimicrobiota bacterium]